LGSEVHISKFIEHGLALIENFIIKKETSDIETYFKMNNIVTILKEIEKDIYIKRLISKDATASVYQHMIKVLGPKNEKILQ
jgi:hypothetical protein